MIAEAAAISLRPTAWTVMPFDFGAPATDMGHASIRALEGLARALSSAYGISTAAAYQMAGVSSMNGHTDEASETVSLEDFQTIARVRARTPPRAADLLVGQSRPAVSCPRRRMQRHRAGAVRVQPVVAGYHG